LEKQGQGQCSGYDAQPEGKEAGARTQFVLVGILKGHNQPKNCQGHEGYTSDLPGFFHPCCSSPSLTICCRIWKNPDFEAAEGKIHMQDIPFLSFKNALSREIFLRSFYKKGGTGIQLIGNDDSKVRAKKRAHAALLALFHLLAFRRKIAPGIHLF
jgi:hypothetical protein